MIFISFDRSPALDLDGDLFASSKDPREENYGKMAKTAVFYAYSTQEPKDWNGSERGRTGKC